MAKAKFIYIFGIFVVLTFSFCKRSNTTWDDNIVAPLATGNLSLGNMFPDTTIKTNADSSLKISFSSNLINYQIDSLLKIPDTTIANVTTSLFTTLAINPGQQLFPLSGQTPPNDNYFDLPNGIQLRNGIIKQGKIKARLYNTVSQPLVYILRLPSATKNGIPLQATYTISAGTQANPATDIEYIDLSGYTIDFTGSSHNTYNTITETYTVSISPNAQPDTVYWGQGLIDSLTFMDIIPQYAQGYFGNQSIIVGPDTATFSAFNAIKGGMLNLNSASVDLKITNELGVYMQATIGNISSINTYNHTTINLNSPQLNSPIIVSSAINNGPNAQVTPITKTISLNDNNSNITSFISNLPGRLGYKLSAQINPFTFSGGGNVTGGYDFGYYGTSFKVDLNVDVPLFFSATNLLLTDTVPIDVSQVSQLQNVNHGSLILKATNSYPFSIALAAYLLDENKYIVDSLFLQPGLIQAPALDINNVVIAPQVSRLIIPVTKSLLNNLQKSRYVYYTAKFNTANQPAQVKFYYNNTLGLLLTADFNYTMGQ